MNEYESLYTTLPSMLTGTALRERMTVLPTYDHNIRSADIAARLSSLNQIYDLYLCSSMGEEIYSKIYLSMLRAIRKKTGTELNRQRNSTFLQIRSNAFQDGIVGGADSYSIVGISGIGKSRSINRAIELCCPSETMTSKGTPFLPVLCVQTPYDSSPKTMMLEILRSLDQQLGTDYYETVAKTHLSGPATIGVVSQALLNHVAVLVIDEIQQIVEYRAGKTLVGVLTQLINSCGISVAFVGTPECEEFLSSHIHLARRSVGLRYCQTEYDDFYKNLCATALNYNYLRNPIIGADGLIHWLYDHSAGIPAITIGLIHAAQEHAILKGTETLNIDSLKAVYEKQMYLLQPYTMKVRRQAARSKSKAPATYASMNHSENASSQDIEHIILEHRASGINTVIEALKDYVSVDEAAI